jgi:hypothetical protein
MGGLGSFLDEQVRGVEICGSRRKDQGPEGGRVCFVCGQEEEVLPYCRFNSNVRYMGRSEDNSDNRWVLLL